MKRTWRCVAHGGFAINVYGSNKPMKSSEDRTGTNEQKLSRGRSQTKMDFP